MLERAEAKHGILPLPPAALMASGSGSPDARSFEEIGQEFLGYFRCHGRLEPTDSVLEVGCGAGRMARALTGYLSPSLGRYDGMDVLADALAWCKENISPAYPSFRFHLVDVSNGTYHREGAETASTFRFPFPSESFDFVFLTSVFTHMLPDGVANYLGEISRVLKQGGRCLATYFLLNESQAAALASRPEAAVFRFPFRAPGAICAVEQQEEPEAAIAYEEDFIRRLYRDRDLSLIEPIYYGRWCGRTEFTSGQDIVVATKSYAPRRRRGWRSLIGR